MIEITQLEGSWERRQLSLRAIVRGYRIGLTADGRSGTCSLRVRAPREIDESIEDLLIGSAAASPMREEEA